MRHVLGWMVAGLLLGIATTGCGPAVPRSELGTIVYEVPTVAGAEEPYRLPDLAPPPGGSSPRGRMPMTPPGLPPDAPKLTPPSESTK